MLASFPNLRLRRLRHNSALRNLVRETHLHLGDLIFPLFIKGRIGKKIPIKSMPGHFQIPLSELQQEIDVLMKLGITSLMLFGIPETKDAQGSDSLHQHGIIQEAIRQIRSHAPEILIMSDVCFCEYTDHGHCGIIDHSSARYHIDNDSTLELLSKQAVSHAEAGVDVVVPSGMMDGTVQAIRKGLDSSGYTHIPILSHSVKYQSSLYGPFREAAEGSPSFGDRSSYQMDTANAAEAIREVHLDVQEGVDMLMVKPAHSYMDIIFRVKQTYPYIPLGAYHTSGEFCMIKAAAEKGWVDEKQTVIEILRGIKRAGADFIITYYAKEIAQWAILNK